MLAYMLFDLTYSRSTNSVIDFTQILQIVCRRGGRCTDSDYRTTRELIDTISGNTTEGHTRLELEDYCFWRYCVIGNERLIRL